MTDKIRYPLKQAKALAEQLAQEMEPVVERIIIAGSIRREKAEVGDIELLYIPKMGRIPDGFFDMKDVNAADELLTLWLRSGIIQQRKKKDDTITWGAVNKLAIHTATGIPIDFFQTNPANWWVSLVIRTGPADFNMRLTTGANRQNLTLNAYGRGVTNRSTGVVTQANSEQEVCALCGVRYMEPKDRR